MATRTGFSVESDAAFFAAHRAAIAGIEATIPTPNGDLPLTYLDWTAMGRDDTRILGKIRNAVERFANTHSELSFTGEFTSQVYEEAHAVVARHVNASSNDIVLFKGSGATGAINWLQYMLGLRERHPHGKRPVVLVTHLEHHSNHTSWVDSNVHVRVVRAGADGRTDLNHLDQLAAQAVAEGRALFGSFSACSNVTGIQPDLHAMARVIHRHGGHCFADYAASAPYVAIDMHPADDPEGYLDAVFFSPHKFMGGPGGAGAIVINRELYDREVPVFVGGGTVKWTDPWGGRGFFEEIRLREDAGTPAIVQAMKAALAIRLKEAMGTERIARRKQVLLDRLWHGMGRIPGVEILEADRRDRQAIVAFTAEGVHYGLLVRLLNDLAGIQARGGCSCAGTYGHYLFHIGKQESRDITQRIDSGDNSCKPGWVRVSLHPTTTESEVDRFLDALSTIVAERSRWAKEFAYDSHHNAWQHRTWRSHQVATDVATLYSFAD